MTVVRPIRDPAPPQSSRLPVDLITGFLGSGKTTLVNAVLRDPAFAGSLVIVNEFGEVGLDHLLVSSAEDQVVLLDSGCLCCSASGSLRDTLIDLLSKRATHRVAPFDRILVETSGLADPAPLVATLIGDSAVTSHCSLAQVLTVVDAVNGMDTLERYEEARRQAAFADRLLISKADQVSPAALDRLRALLTASNGHALCATWGRHEAPSPHFTTPLRVSSVSASLHRSLPNPHADTPGPQTPGDHGSAFRRITTHVLDIPDSIDWETYALWTRQLSVRFGKRLLRCKGLMALGDVRTPMVVQGVRGWFAPPEPLQEWPSAIRRGFLVCIGESIRREELDAIVAPPSPAS